MLKRPLLFLCLVALAGASCEFAVKVPITDVNAQFTLAEAIWYEEEETLFFFYRLEAEQGLGPQSQLEVSWRNDAAEQPWANLAQLQMVHEHQAVDCGPYQRCGSASLRIAQRPREVGLRLRYHRDGELFLVAPLGLNLITTGAPSSNRSLLVYGVFDATNTRVQWRARHQFPTVRNHEAQELGLRRRFQVRDPGYGALAWPRGNPYGYGFAPRCPSPAFSPLGFGLVETSERAVFSPEALPPPAYAAPQLCAQATVFDARGPFATAALARKNPEVAAAYPSVHSPVQENVALRFLLRPCQRDISPAHLTAQEQRLLLAGAPLVCIDGWSAPGFAQTLASRFLAAADAQRGQGKDMVLTFSLHHDDTTGRLRPAVESALETFLAPEQARSSPRVSGAFVFDSAAYTVTSPVVRRLALWCPANALGDDLDLIPAQSERSCPLQPDIPDLQLGPFKFNLLPILPTRAQYLKFIEKYSEGQAGHMKALRFRAPSRTPLSENVALGDFGVATFFNNEVMTAAASDRFSYCAPEEGPPPPVVFRVPGAPGAFPLASLPELHETGQFSAYGMGLGWDFPFLLRLEYETSVAGAATVANFTVPFGVATQQNAYYGTRLWEQGAFPLSDLLSRCTRYCDHPTFSSSGTYDVLVPFSPGYRTRCYRPEYPKPDDGGFPLDP